MRAMPSPTSSTRPTSRAVTSWPESMISRSSTETISSALNLITTSLNELFADVVQPGADAGVVDPVVHLHDQAAQQVRVGAGLQDRLAAEGSAQLVAQPLLLVVGQGHR